MNLSINLEKTFIQEAPLEQDYTQDLDFKEEFVRQNIEDDLSLERLGEAIENGGGLQSNKHDEIIRKSIEAVKSLSLEELNQKYDAGMELSW